ncbi:MAG: alcohol dehydrogenase catalytic domain-containing protein [Thermoplasmata archaeon]|nr:alcohol dehydrogenase catalytic domain-containing protein [Thermoplasmata archaeon]
MKVGVLRAPGAVVLEDVPRPVAGPGEIVVELAACGVCGTDLEKLRGNYAGKTTLGHEPAGVVREIGEGVTSLRTGERVFVHHHVPCYTCAVCQRGDLTFCPSYGSTNLDPGGFAEAFRVSAEHVRKGAVLPLAASATWEDGALLEPAACALTAIHSVHPPTGATVAVLGLGPVGLLYARLLRTVGASWVGATEISPLRRDAGLRGGVDAVADPRDPAAFPELVRQATGGVGVDLAVVATGAPSAVRLAFESVRRGGTVNLFGLPEAGSRLDIDVQSWYLRGVRVVPTYATTEKDIAAVHALLASGRLALRDLTTDKLPLDRVAEAFDRARHPDSSVKVVVTGPAYSGG